MTAAGVWTYTLDNANSTVQALNVGDTLTDTFTVTTVDGTAEVVTITIHGSQRRRPQRFRLLGHGDARNIRSAVRLWNSWKRQHRGRR